KKTFSFSQTNLPPAEFMRRRIFPRFARKTAMRKAPSIRLISAHGKVGCKFNKIFVSRKG
ncbi:MAG TPA: hypothetical protein PLK02_07945, partial [Paludibacteraceae bacterium]|nr:hypothetical protein [Paludibacteraceae bacterium]